MSKVFDTKACEGYTQNAYKGSNYQSGRGVKEIAKDIRQDIKDLINQGKLPQGKYSVTIERFAGGSSIDISIKGFNGPILNLARIEAEKVGHDLNVGSFNHHYPVYSKELREAYDLLTLVLDSYREQDSDGMIDYFSTNFYGHVRIDWQLEEQAKNSLKQERSA